MVEFVLVWYNERCEICRCWQRCFILSPCTLTQLFDCWYAWRLYLNGLTSESDGLIANLGRQFHFIQGSAFRVCFNFDNFHTACVASVDVVPESVYDDVVYIRTSVWSRHWQLRITHLQNLFILSGEKAWNVNMNSASMSFFLPREVSVLSMAQIWRNGLRMCCSGLCTEGHNIKRSWKGIGITPVAWHFTCQTVLSLRCNIKGISYNTS